MGGERGQRSNTGQQTNPDSLLQEIGSGSGRERVCGVRGRQGQVDLSQAEPFISYAGAYAQCLGDLARDAVD